MTTDIRAGDVRLLSKHEAQQRVLELLESEDRLCARIRDLEGERMSREEVEMCIDCLRWAHYSSHYQRGVRLALADRLACGLLEKMT